MSSGGGGNPLNKVGKGVNDLYGSIKEDPIGVATRYGSAFALNTVAGIPTQAGIDTGMRTRQDMQDQAAGMAQKEQDAAASAERRALDASVKDLDPIALERRRRAMLAANKGRAGTILTAGTSLGSADVGRKVLLGL